MIAYLKGNVLYSTVDSVVLDVNGMGYEVLCSGSAYAKLVGAKAGEVYTYLQVKEDGVALFGFSSLDEKAMFLKLLAVTGVGPKMAIGVLSAMNLAELSGAIALADVKRLMAVKGLGKKTAERIVLELKDKMTATELLSGDSSAPVVSTPVSEDNDAVGALMGLGFTRNESLQAIQKAKQAGAKTVEEVIMIALKNM